MRKIILLFVLAALAWKGYEKYTLSTQVVTEPVILTAGEEPVTAPAPKIQIGRRASFVCDGRTYCSQMTSCEEATYFLQHCPNVKMDGNNDGIPCEKQWCR
ncbi:DNA-binding protein [Pseudoduganella eburnea]|uniref:DNA-binding protein n=1 Tax=Massilia eburnea TaxID=1776165 RepID=A0A6L6QPY5_9BURK|nr:excalibur calcium-binding domain-containing protein [Massilia eburnea]MTW14280.1 DNA-binding protein [Massilia eburnea]